MDITTTLYSTRGAVTAVSAALGISDAAVSQWKKRGIPDARRVDVERALRVHLETLARPGAAS